MGDGRFHIESTMIKNGHLKFYQFNPYTQQFTLEAYDTPKMQGLRLAEVEKAKSAQLFGIILGTLGRQGSTTILESLENEMKNAGRKYFVVLMSEINLEKL